MKKITMPLCDDTIRSLKAGEEVLLSGVVYTARDQAHKRMAALARSGRRLPIPPGSVLYYCGPTPARRPEVIGSCGPTTSSRMDAFTPLLLRKGLRVAIGKGGRSDGVKKAIKKHKGLYFVTYGGCGVYINKCVKKCQLVAFRDLGPEAIYKLVVKDLPVIVAFDSRGASTCM